jgi:hypothetical protein
MAVIVPEGCRHVGWLCEHEYIYDEHGRVDWENGPYTPHREKFYGQRPKRDKERGYTVVTNVSQSYDFRRDGDYNESDCPARVPVFLQES